MGDMGGYGGVIWGAYLEGRVCFFGIKPLVCPRGGFYLYFTYLLSSKQSEQYQYQYS